MEKRVTVKYNVAMTAVFFGYAVISSLWTERSAERLLLADVWEASPAVAVVVGLLSFTCMVVISMYVMRSLWNRLFPSICGWREIDLTEAYAICLLGAFCSI